MLSALGLEGDEIDASSSGEFEDLRDGELEDRFGSTAWTPTSFWLNS